MPSLRNLRGITLIEMMVTIAIVAILAAIAAPSFNGLLLRNRIAGEVNGLVSAVYLARSEAVRSNQAATVSLATSAANLFNSGWAVAGTNVNKAATALHPTISLVEVNNANTLVNNPHPSTKTISFSGNGTMTAANTVYFRFCPTAANTGVTGRRAEITVSGRVSLSDAVCP